MVIFLFCFNFLLYSVNNAYYFYFRFRQKKIYKTLVKASIIKNKQALFTLRFLFYGLFPFFEIALLIWFILAIVPVVHATWIAYLFLVWVITTDLCFLLAIVLFGFIINSFFVLYDEMYLYLFEEKILITPTIKIKCAFLGKITFHDEFGSKKKILCGKKFCLQVQKIIQQNNTNKQKVIQG